MGACDVAYSGWLARKKFKKSCGWGLESVGHDDALPCSQESFEHITHQTTYYPINAFSLPLFKFNSVGSCWVVSLLCGPSGKSQSGCCLQFHRSPWEVDDVFSQSHKSTAKDDSAYPTRKRNRTGT